jgi:hypothetical protein
MTKVFAEKTALVTSGGSLSTQAAVNIRDRLAMGRTRALYKGTGGNPAIQR